MNPSSEGTVIRESRILSAHEKLNIFIAVVFVSIILGFAWYSWHEYQKNLPVALLSDSLNTESQLGANIGGALLIYTNAILPNVDGLSNLQSVNYFLGVEDNPLLIDLSGFTNLQAVHGLLGINSNTSLENLNGLENIDPLTIDYLNILDNPQLSICNIQPICDYLSIPSNVADISGNATGCATRAQVEAECLLILPVELLTLQAQPQKTNTHLTWRTASESQNSHFEVEHSRNGASFQSIGQVPGHGTTTEPNEYSFTHERPGPGTHYYRLRQVDFDGSHSYSHIVSVAFQPQKTEHITLYPNPVGEQLTLTSHNDEPLELTVHDLLGQEVGRLLLEPDRQTTTVVADWLPGIYFLMGNVGGERVRWLFVKQ